MWGYLAWYMGSGIQTLVLMIPQQALWPMSHLSSTDDSQQWEVKGRVWKLNKGAGRKAWEVLGSSCLHWCSPWDGTVSVCVNFSFLCETQTCDWGDQCMKRIQKSEDSHVLWQPDAGHKGKEDKNKWGNLYDSWASGAFQERNPSLRPRGIWPQCKWLQEGGYYTCFSSNPDCGFFPKQRTWNFPIKTVKILELFRKHLGRGNLEMLYFYL